MASWHKKYLANIQSETTIPTTVSVDFPKRKTKLIFGILLVIIFSKFIYAASLSNYYSFYLIEKFNLTIKQSQFHLFIYLFSYMLGTIIGVPLGDKFGRAYVIWFSVLGATPFILILPYANLFYTDVLMVVIGLINGICLSCNYFLCPRIITKKIGVISGLFYGFAFGVAAIGSALIGLLADYTSIYFVYQICSFLPLTGIVCFFLPNLKGKLISNYFQTIIILFKQILLLLRQTIHKS